mmetsp:Transcript_12913/g.36375  ORF Transcript_12913/g.36375 Transcript_12913/m.36375 type:complete len:242 (+) Transcript_12913:502-1227(+)
MRHLCQWCAFDNNRHRSVTKRDHRRLGVGGNPRQNLVSVLATRTGREPGTREPGCWGEPRSGMRRRERNDCRESRGGWRGVANQGRRRVCRWRASSRGAGWLGCHRWRVAGCHWCGSDGANRLRHAGDTNAEESRPDSKVDRRKSQHRGRHPLLRVGNGICVFATRRPGSEGRDVGAEVVTSWWKQGQDTQQGFRSVKDEILRKKREDDSRSNTKLWKLHSGRNARLLEPIALCCSPQKKV